MTDQIDQVEILHLAASSFRQVALMCPARHHHRTTLHMLCLLQQLHLCLDHPTWRWCAPLDITTEGQIVRVVRARDQRYTLIIQIRNLSPIHKQVFILLLLLTHSSFTQESLSSSQTGVYLASVTYTLISHAGISLQFTNRCLSCFCYLHTHHSRKNLSPIHKQVFILLLLLTHSSFTQESLSNSQTGVYLASVTYTLIVHCSH